MAKKKKSPTAAPSQPTPAPQFPDSLTLKIEPDARIQVTVAQAEQSAKPLNRRLKWLIFVAIPLSWLWREQMTREYWNPFFQSVQTIRIGYLGELDARQLITDPIDQFPLAYDEEAIDRITEVTNAHPYLAQSVCHNLVNRLNDPLYRSNRASAEDVDAVLERTLESSGYYFDDYVWGWSNRDERLALALIAEAGDEANFAVVEKHLGREAALKATQSLVSRDLIVERTERDDLVFRFRIPLSRMWVRRTKSSARILLEREI